MTLRPKYRPIRSMKQLDKKREIISFVRHFTTMVSKKILSLLASQRLNFIKRKIRRRNEITESMTTGTERSVLQQVVTLFEYEHYIHGPDNPLPVGCSVIVLTH